MTLLATLSMSPWQEGQAARMVEFLDGLNVSAHSARTFSFDLWSWLAADSGNGTMLPPVPMTILHDLANIQQIREMKEYCERMIPVKAAVANG